MKILIIKPSSLGDVIHALPFLKAVKDTFPESTIDWIISSGLEGLLEGNPLINELIVINKDSWKRPKNIRRTSRELINLRRRLSSRGYDLVIDLQGLLRSGVISRFATSSLKIGFADAREGSRYLYDRRVSVNGIAHAVDKNLAVARAIGARIRAVKFPLFIDHKARESIRRLLNGIEEYIVIIPSARWPTKRWPEEGFARLIERVSLPCVIAGGGQDRHIAQRISRLSRGRPINICGETSLKELSALISGARVVVSPDTGPMHIAVALGVPVVALYGPTDPVRTGPYGWQWKDNIRVISSGAPCSPCLKKRCKEPLCMTGIGVDMVVKEVEGLI